jgi:lipid A ethanolaminephosphotransferase
MVSVPVPPLSRLRLPEWQLDTNQLAWIAAVFFSLTGSTAFWHQAWATGELHGWAGAWIALALALMVLAANVLLASLLLVGRAAKPVLALLLCVAAAAAYFSWHYGVYVDDDMLRNVLHTDVAESRELLGPGLWLYLLAMAGLPLALLSRVRICRRPLRQAVVRRLLQLGAGLALLVLALALAFQPVSGLMHAHRDLRNLVAPANVLVSAARIAFDTRRPHAPRRVVGADARVASPLAGRKPRVLVLVVGETVRAQDWGLNGYRRQTTPQVAALDPVNFPDVTSCGSATEVSLPCMFSAVGRRDYDRDRIETSESLLHVLQRAGIGTLWRDNQTGCKGVCEGLPFESFRHAAARCGGECPDAILLDGLDERLDVRRGDQVIVLHMLGNHGPSYFRRYARSAERFVPACHSDELADCSVEQIVNAYDNAVLQTDDLLARLVRQLAARPDVDTAMLYVSDHGESLGENGLFLHGMPYAIAPREQTRVPTVLWLSHGFAADRGIDVGCLRARARQPASHDNLFHTVLGLMDVSTRDRDPALDLVRGCTAAARR